VIDSVDPAGAESARIANSALLARLMLSVASNAQISHSGIRGTSSPRWCLPG